MRNKFDEEELRAKKVFSKIEVGSKSTYNYKKKDFNFSITNSNLPKKRNTEVVIKITSGSKHFQAISKHIDYISREGNLKILTSDLETYLGKDENLEIKSIYKNDGMPIPNFGEEKKERRHSINMVFSMRDHSNAPENKIKEAVFKTIKSKFPDNFFVIAFHGDTDNPHCHVCLKVANSNGKRINIKKQDLANLRVDFAKNLNDLGIEATASKIKNYEPSFEKKLIDKKEIKTKMHYYQLVDFGEAKYKFDEKNKDSFFAQYRTKKGITTIWSNDLKRVVKENNLKKGEMVKFKIIGKQEYSVKRKAKIDGKFEIVQKTLTKPIWGCSVLGREEKSEKIQILPEVLRTKKYQIIKSKIQFKKVDNEKINREQYRQRVIQERTSKSSRREFLATARNNMRILSKESMVRQREHIGMLLHTDALHKLEYRRTGQSNFRVRWSATRDIRTSSRANEKTIGGE
ncbi:relaxase/mobilization nuclease domain-containing protein (plasmid) [Campylobacter fetus]|uniref:Relaxase/mobilization nuclease domain-containing protein n=1 Tax=Campylobacter fetus TaxID=196 RepID=A0A974MV34_CAMFE|nr:MobP1 family relaxase [Campylobacter fetus]MBK3501321.1 relaxase/mobilization nuclease domain-containing protein [Campylobacter fetus subsp. venerealis]MBK3503379.1 relaxase/mobilization nuclease domain-containing protein [Campylobacter fetus subsp. venerealis]MBK3505173.1 relaxase/mobilization nuclease domain-containing protein [Campylobacter fetus subsp. venerealis]OCS14792.1 hypothetical protein CfvWBT01109_09950 [Campylobacter fetus subsp. venerealis]OCS32539.1 hypothetical protein AWR3